MINSKIGYIICESDYAQGPVNIQSKMINGKVVAEGIIQTANEKKVDTNIPRVIDALKGYRIIDIAAGGSHSAVVDDKGHVFMVYFMVYF